MPGSTRNRPAGGTGRRRQVDRAGPGLGSYQCRAFLRWCPSCGPGAHTLHNEAAPDRATTAPPRPPLAVAEIICRMARRAAREDHDTGLDIGMNTAPGAHREPITRYVYRVYQSDTRITRTADYVLSSPDIGKARRRARISKT